MRRPELAIVGGGPNCTYGLERLAALLPRAELPHGLCIHVFDEGGRFGCGATHSDTQARTSYMNRVASQIAFAADESNRVGQALAPRDSRPTFVEWCRAKYEETGAERFKLEPHDVPLRYLHGEALREFFQSYVAALNRIQNVQVELHAAQVVDVRRGKAGGAPFRVHAIGERDEWFDVDRVLFVTGHSNNNLRPGTPAAALMEHGARMPPARYIPQSYPLTRYVTETAVPPGCTAAVLGMGLTAIDALLHLTEGRGGTFVQVDQVDAAGSVRYVPSGREPAVIVASSPSGLFTSCRPVNAKAVDASGVGHAALEHKGVFLTIDGVRELRQRHGIPAQVSEGEVRQLDFERHVLPVVVLELAYVYYSTLLGPHFGRLLRERAEPRYRSFLADPPACYEHSIATLLEPVQACFDGAAACIDAVDRDASATPMFEGIVGAVFVNAFRLTVYGPGGGSVSPWGHSPRAADHRFDWRALFTQVNDIGLADGDTWSQRVIAYMRRDHLAAAQGNLRNPTKAACDGVFRDLRAVLAEIADFGGLTAKSHRRFVDVYLRFYSRLSNGTGLEAMRKVLALVESGIVDISTGPGARVESVLDRPAFVVTGPKTGTWHEVTVVIEGRAHPFDAEWDAGPCYPRMLRHGLVRLWRNPGGGFGEDYVPGALDLTRDFHPVGENGEVERRLTFLGASVEGLAFFQLSAARPQSNSAVLNNVARWAAELVVSLAAPRSLAAKEAGRS